MITWTEPEANVGCAVTYLVKYTIGDEEDAREATVDEEALSATIEEAVPSCTDLHVEIWAVREDEDPGEEYFVNDFKGKNT